MPNLTYADRVLYQLRVRGSTQSFTPDELVDEVICTMIVNEEKISRVARTYIRGHITYLRIVYLLVRDTEDEDRVRPAAKLATELDRIPQNVLDNDPVRMKKYADLVKIGAYPLKRLTVKELRQRLLEMQDERDDLRRDRDRLLKECERLQAELDAAKRGPIPTEEIPMDVDTEEEAQELNASPSSQVQSQPRFSVAPLRRTPTLDYIDPVTPPRRSKSHGSQYLPSPPVTEERPRRRISRTSSRAQPSFQDVGPPMDASIGSRSSDSHELPPQNDVSVSALEEVVAEARREVDGIFGRVEAAVAAEREANVSREQVLQQNNVILTVELEEAQSTFRQAMAEQAVALQAEQTARQDAEQKAREAQEETERIQRERDQIEEQYGRQEEEQCKKIKQYESKITECHNLVEGLRNRVQFHAGSRTTEAYRVRWERGTLLQSARQLQQEVEQFMKQAAGQADAIRLKDQEIREKDKTIKEKNDAIRVLAQQMKACAEAADALAAEK